MIVKFKGREPNHKYWNKNKRYELKNSTYLKQVVSTNI